MTKQRSCGRSHHANSSAHSQAIRTGSGKQSIAQMISWLSLAQTTKLCDCGTRRRGHNWRRFMSTPSTQTLLLCFLIILIACACASHVYDLQFHPNGSCIASASADCTINMWDTRSRQLIQHYAAHTAAVTSVAFHSSGNYLMSGSVDKTVRVSLCPPATPPPAGQVRLANSKVHEQPNDI